MSKVQIVPNAKTAKLVTPYSGNSEFGYLMLGQTSTEVTANQWLREKNLRTILKGSVKALDAFVADNPSLELEGKLVVQEHLENAIPAAVAKANFDEKLEFEEQIKSFVKRAGSEGPALTVGGERIVRFVVWDASDSMSSATIAHDNVEEIAAYNETVNSEEKAEL